MKEINRDFEELGHLIEMRNILENPDKVSKIIT